MGYLTRIEALDFNRSFGASPAKSRVFLLTGQSSFRGTRLSKEQEGFLRAVAPAQSDPLLAAFPYHPDFAEDEGEPGLPAASVRNALQFVWSVYWPRFQRAVACALQPLFANTGSSLYIITGSCGLQLLAGAWPSLRIPEDLAIRVVAIGPAMFRPFTLDPHRIHAIQGRSDFWSRMLYRGEVAGRCRVGHLQYWQSAETRREVARLLAMGEP